MLTGMPFTAPRYSVATSAPLSDTHNGLVGEALIPHGLTKFVSCTWATPGWSDTRLVCV